MPYRILDCRIIYSPSKCNFGERSAMRSTTFVFDQLLSFLFFFRPWAGEELRLSPCRLIFTFFFSIAGRVLRWTLTASLRRFVDESRHFFSPPFLFFFFITQDRFNRNGRINSPSSCCLDGGGETGSDSLPTVTKSSGMRGEWGIFMFKRQELCILEISMLVWTGKKKDWDANK